MQTAFRRFPPGNRAQRLGQRLADKIDMGFGRGTCGLRLALDNRAVNGGMRPLFLEMTSGVGTVADARRVSLRLEGKGRATRGLLECDTAFATLCCTQMERGDVSPSSAMAATGSVYNQATSTGVNRDSRGNDA